ncbi:MAG: hypothetical protein RLZZ336_312 [Cyanobacteriota bacterium]|jgi:hypothetical protein
MNQHTSAQQGTAPAPWGGSGAGHPQEREHQAQTWDAMESYFECITTCSLDDGECVTHCVNELRERS